MFAVSYLFAYSFNIMRMSHPIVPVRAPPDPVRVIYSGSDDTTEQVPYIVYLNGRVPEMYELLDLNAHGVREVHPFARVQLFDNFREDNFNTFFFNYQRCRIPFVGWRSLNNSVEFLRFVHVNSDSEVVIYTPNIFVRDWGNNPTMIYPTVSSITRCAYDPITIQHGLVLQCNHERLRLKRVERKHIGLENHLTRICQDTRDNVVNNACYPANHALGDATSLHYAQQWSSVSDDLVYV